MKDEDPLNHVRGKSNLQRGNCGAEDYLILEVRANSSSKSYGKENNDHGNSNRATSALAAATVET